MATQIKLQRNDILVREGEPSHSMYFVQSGELIVSRKDEGQDVILGIIRSGEIVGELSFLDEKPRSATVKAMSDCTLILIPRRMIEEIFQSQPKWFEVMIKTLTRRMRETDKKLKI